ncbi:MAG: sigma-70 family RNA polymerase sigma factor [Anaerolineales bacterium]
MSISSAPPVAAELDLIEQAQQGNRDAFGELVLMHYQGAINVVYRLSGDLQFAEDIAQETFIRVWDKLHTYRPVGSFRSWVYRIATNAALDTLRRKREEVDIEDVPLSAPGSGVEQTIIRQQQAELVRQAVVELPEASRVVLVLREYEGLSYQEIADSLQIPVGTVMSRLSYARGALKKTLRRQMEVA